MRLKSIEISGFRGFAARKKFDLSADAIVIMGVNGIGKTSLLDAILWSLAGKVERIGSDKDLVSLYSDSGEARASVLLSNDGGEEIVVTRVSDGMSQSVQVVIEGKEYKGPSGEARLMEKLWPDAISASDGDAVLNSAFLCSVYLQQDRVRDFLEAETDQVRFNVISELVGTGRLTDLQLQLERERNSWTRATNQKIKETESLAETVNELEVQYEKLRQSSAINVDNSVISWSEWWSVSKSLGVAFSDTPSADSVEASNKINEAIQQLQNIRAKAERRHTAALALKELLEKEPSLSGDSVESLRVRVEEHERIAKETTNKLESARKKAAEVRKQQMELQELKEQQRALAQIALKLLTDVCPVCQQEYDIEETRERLGELVSTEEKVEILDVETEESVAELALAEKEAFASLGEGRKLLIDAEAELARHKEWSSQRDHALSGLGIEIDDLKRLPEQIDKTIAECEEQAESLLNHRKVGEQLALNLARESAKARISTVKGDLEKAREEFRSQRMRVEYRNQTGTTVNLLLEKLREAATQVAIDRLEQIEPVLQSVYSRIDPHPAFRVVKLATSFSRGRGGLDAEVFDTVEGIPSANPNVVLSSSQLNALAVSIFLSLNLALPRLPIDAAMLDDPIQSLDDINLLGIVDLLRRTKDRRQVIVSTHDERFGKLLARKLRPANTTQRTSVIELHGWTRSGPDIRQYEIKPQEVPLRLIQSA